MESGLAARAYDGDLRVLPPSYAVSVRFLIGTSMLEGMIVAMSLGWMAVGEGGL